MKRIVILFSCHLLFSISCLSVHSTENVPLETVWFVEKTNEKTTFQEIQYEKKEEIVVKTDASTPEIHGQEEKTIERIAEQTKEKEAQEKQPDKKGTPCGASAWGFCNEKKNIMEGCNEKGWSIASAPCVSSIGNSGACCVYNNPCEMGGKCVAKGSTCDPLYDSAPQTSCYDNGTSGVCCKRKEASDCSLTTNLSFKLSGKLLPTGALRASFTIELPSFPASWLEQPIVKIPMDKWTIEKETWDSAKPNQLEIQVLMDGFGELKKTARILVYSFLSIESSGLGTKKNCSHQREIIVSMDATQQNFQFQQQ